MHPVARLRSLVLRDIGDETLVYDLDTHQASCLNREAASVLRACNGHRTIPEIASRVGKTLGREIDEHYVALAISRLAQSGLIDTITESPGRRELLRRVAATAMVALPAVTSVLAPEPAQAQTCLANGANCTMSAQCCSGCCMTNFMCGGMAGGMNCGP